MVEQARGAGLAAQRVEARAPSATPSASSLAPRRAPEPRLERAELLAGDGEIARRGVEAVRRERGEQRRLPLRVELLALRRELARPLPTSPLGACRAPTRARARPRSRGRARRAACRAGSRACRARAGPVRRSAASRSTPAPTPGSRRERARQLVERVEAVDRAQRHARRRAVGTATAATSGETAAGSKWRVSACQPRSDALAAGMSSSSSNEGVSCQPTRASGTSGRPKAEQHRHRTAQHARRDRGPERARGRRARRAHRARTAPRARGASARA